MKGRLILGAAVGAVLLATLVPISLAAGAPADDLYVKGAVTRRDKPIRAAWVIVSRDGQEQGHSLTGDDGRYFIGDLHPGEYEVVVKQGGRNVFSGHVRLPEGKVYNIQLR